MSLMEIEYVEYPQSEPIPINKYVIRINHLRFKTFRFNLNRLILYHIRIRLVVVLKVVALNSKLLFFGPTGSQDGTFNKTGSARKIRHPYISSVLSQIEDYIIITISTFPER